MPFQDVNGIRLYYSIHQAQANSSRSQTVVLVNGLADDQSTWEPQIPALTQAGYTVLCFDNRGVGNSSRPTEPYTARILADDLHDLLLALEIRRFHLLGISMGGMIAQSYALAYPNGSPQAQGLDVLSLSLCCTYAEPTPFCSRMFALWADMAAKMSVQDVMRDVVLWCFTVPFFREQPELLSEIDKAMANLDIGLEEYLAQLNVIQVFDSTEALNDIRKADKTLGNLYARNIMVLAGEQDILIPTQLSKELNGLIPGSIWRTVPGGHCCALEFADDFNQTVLGFLASRS